MKIGELSGESLELATNTLLALLGCALVYYLLYLDPVGYVYFITEDYWAEWGTFVGWAMTFCLLAWMLLKDKDARKPVVFLLCLGALFVAGEEISWGQRILGLRTPDFFAKGNTQREITIHNLRGHRSSIGAVVGIAVFLLPPLLARRWTRLREWYSRLGMPIVPYRLWPFFLLAVYFNIFSSLKRSEAAELCLGMAMAALSLDLVLTKRLGTRARGVVPVAATAGMILTLGILTAVLVRLWPWPAVLKNNLNRLAVISLPAAGMHRQAAILSDYMSRNPEFLTVDPYREQAVRLIRKGRPADAKVILEGALAEQARLQQRHPGHPAPLRVAGQLLTLLARPQQAERAFLDAIESDRARLDRANDGAAKAWIHFSLGETFLAMEDSETASKQFALARALAPDRITRWQMDDIRWWWEKKNKVAR